MRKRLALLFPFVFVLAGCAHRGAKAPAPSATAPAAQSLRSALPLMQDFARSRPENPVHVVVRHADGSVFYDHWTHNLRTNAGINWQYGQMAGTPGSAALYIALSSDTTTPAAADTTLTGEITSGGLARAAATPTHTSNATSYTLSYTWTASATQTSVQKAAVFTASTSGTMPFENTFTSVTMASGDTITVTWTINF